jgi:Uri superfamily endonuclease
LHLIPLAHFSEVHEVKSGRGSYLLLFHCRHAVTVTAGKLGALQLQPGYYLYCGSAFGPGGVKARTEHHRRISQHPHWHIDYLRPHLQLLEIWYTFDPQPREHQWAAQLAELRGATRPFTGFGASDCQCDSHLVRLGYKPSFSGFRKRLRRQVSPYGRFYREIVTSLPLLER